MKQEDTDMMRRKLQVIQRQKDSEAKFYKIQIKQIAKQTDEMKKRAEYFELMFKEKEKECKMQALKIKELTTADSIQRQKMIKKEQQHLH